ISVELVRLPGRGQHTLELHSTEVTPVTYVRPVTTVLAAAFGRSAACTASHPVGPAPASLRLGGSAMSTLVPARRWTRLLVARSVLIGIAACAAAERATLAAHAEAGGPAAARAVDNLRAFAKLYGYVRYFHPADAAGA